MPDGPDTTPPAPRRGPRRPRKAPKRQLTYDELLAIVRRAHANRDDD